MGKRLKKLTSLCLAIIMIFGVLTVAPFTVSATGRTQAEAVAWAKSQLGKSLDYDGAYGAQCVDLIAYYYSYLGESVPGGNGCDYATNKLPSGWSRIKYYSGFVAQPGDVAVWTYGSNAYGHVGIVITADSTSMTVIDQNGSKTGVVAYTTYKYTSMTFYGVNRPNFSSTSTHTHSYDTAVYYWASHPHYMCYQCSCGDVQPNKSETVVLDTCSSCLAAYKATVKTDKEVYTQGDTVNISWNSVAGATHYFLWIWKLDDSGEYVPYSNNNGLKTTGFSLSNAEAGKYEIRFYTYNSNFWKADGSDWFRSEADRVYYTVNQNVSPSSVSLSESSLSLTTGETSALTATVEPSNASTSYTWSSSDTSVATVDSNGNVTATGAGTATITVKTSNGLTASCEVTVKLSQSERAIYSIDISQENENSVKVGQAIDIYNDIEGFLFDIYYDDGSTELVTYYDGYLFNDNVSYTVDHIYVDYLDEPVYSERTLISFYINEMYYDLSLTAEDEDGGNEYGIESIELISQGNKTFDIGQEIDPYEDIEGFEFEITYTDGSTETVTYSAQYLSNEYVSYYVNGFSWGGDTYEIGENVITIDIDGFCFDISVYVKDSNVSSIEIIKLPDKTEYIKDVDEGSVDLSGLEVLITYTDGTSKVYKEDESYLYDDEHIWTVNSKFLYEMPLGTNTIQLEYHGWITSFDINIIEDPYIKNPVTNIEVTKLPEKTFTNAVDPSWIDYEINYGISMEESSGIEYLELCKDYLINKNMKGAEITVYYADGTTKVFEIEENCTLQGNASHGWYYWEEENDRSFHVTDLGDFEAEVEFEGVTTTFSVADNGNDDNNYDFEVIGIEIIGGPNAPSSMEYCDYVYNGTAINVSGLCIHIYTTGESDLEWTLGSPDSTTADEDTWTAYYSDDLGDMLVVTYYKDTMTALLEYKGFTGEFMPCIIVEDASVTTLPGDINDDGKVNLRDVTRLYQYIAGWDVTVAENSADVNGDGKENLRDVTRLYQYVAGWDVTIY